MRLVANHIYESIFAPKLLSLRTGGRQCGASWTPMPTQPTQPRRRPQRPRDPRRPHRPSSSTATASPGLTRQPTVRCRRNLWRTAYHSNRVRTMQRGGRCSPAGGARPTRSRRAAKRAGEAAAARRQPQRGVGRVPPQAPAAPERFQRPQQVSRPPRPRRYRVRLSWPGA